MPKTKKRPRALTPLPLQRCVASVAPEMKAKGRGVGAAFAICTSQLQKAGQLRPGTRKSTPRGAGVASGIVRRGEKKTTTRTFERAITRPNGARTPAYPFLVVEKATGRVHAGADTRSDAEDFRRDLPLPAAELQVLTREGVRRKFGRISWTASRTTRPNGRGRSSGMSLEEKIEALRQKSYAEGLRMGHSIEEAEWYADRKTAPMRDDLSRAYARRRG